MTVKILVTATNTHIIADVKQVEQEETKALVAYWLKGARLIQYGQTEGGELAVNFVSYCPLATDAEFAILQPSQILSILDPAEAALKAYEEHVNPPAAEGTAEAAEAAPEAAAEAPAEGEDVPTVAPEVTEG